MPRSAGWGKTEFGSKLREIREAKGMSQRELGEMSNVHPNTIAKMERGEQEPAWPLVLAFAAALGVDCNVFGGLVQEEVDTSAPKPKRGRPKKPGT